MADSTTTNGKNAKSNTKLHQRSDVVRSAIRILEGEKEFRNIKVLGRGTYGDVHLMYDPDRESAIAVKIVTSENISESELVLWPKLQHPNIIKLLEVLTLSPLEVAIFIMPVQRTTLNDILYKRHFIRSYDALEKVKAWLYQILCGLEYLHSQELCHLDIKVDNILISNSSVAMLCDFSFLNVATKPLERYDLGLPYIYRPPEACQSIGSNVLVDGKSYDLWGYGVMLVEVFTHFHLANTLPHSRCWLQDVYPTMYTILQEHQFIFLMMRTFLGVHICKDHARMALNFIHGFLMVDFEKRVSTLEATQHPFLKRGTILAPPSDVIWKQKMSTDVETIAKFNKKLMKKFATKVENIYQEEDISEIGLSEENDFGENEGSMYFTSTETDGESENSFEDELSDDVDDLMGEPNFINIKKINETDDIEEEKVLDKEIEDEANILSSLEKETCSKKFKSYKNSLQRLNNIEYELSSSIKNIHCNQSEKTTEINKVCESRGNWRKSSLPSINLENTKQGCSSSSIEHFEKDKTMTEVNSHFTMESTIPKTELFPDIFQNNAYSETIKFDFLRKNSETMESTSFCENDLNAKEPTIIDTRSQENEPYSQDLDKETSQKVKEDINKDVNPSKCPSEVSHIVPSTDSKWATGDSIHSGNSPEKLSSNEEDAETDQISVTKQVKSLRQRLSKLDHMFDEMEKVMVCENCFNMGHPEKSGSNLVEIKPTECSDIAASGENFHTSDTQNSYQDLSRNHCETFDDVDHNTTGLLSDQELNIQIGRDTNNNIFGGSRRTTGRRRKIVQWIRYKYLDMERIVKRWPYKVMKDPR